MPHAPRILLVDDEPKNLKLLEVQLAPHGYELLTASTGDAALQQAAAHDVDLILLDVMMPGLNGFEVTRRLRAQERTRLIPIVLLTALHETEDRIQGIKAGCDDFLSKPFDRHELLARVKTLLQIGYYRSLLDEKEKFEHVMNHIQDGIVVLDRHGGIVRLNEQAAALLGVEAARPPADLIRALPDRFTIHDAGDLAQAITTAPLAFDLERSETETARALILAVRSRVVRDPAGAISSIVLTLRDVTDERKEEVLKRTFLDLISHKLHTPLAIITVNASTLHDGVLGPLTPQQQEAVDMILETADDFNELLGKVLRFTTRGTEALPPGEPLVLEEFLPPLIETLTKRTPQKPVEWQLQCERRDAATRLNRFYLELIFGHLVDNAIQFNDQDRVRLAVRVRPQDGQLAISIEDNGRGIPPEEQRRIFTTFYQVEKDFTGNVEGAGLGLALVKRLVTSYGGTIELHSELGRGTTFTFTVPATSRTPDA